MTFAQYVDDLAKRGVIDGMIAENLMGLHNDEAGNPKGAVQKVVMPVLDEMWAWPHDGNCSIAEAAIQSFANRIDDAIDALDFKGKGAK